MLQIRLFGKPQVICDGTDITPELGNKGCALLCILFLRGGDYYAREKLAAYLWPDSASSAAKYNLRYTLWKIKKSTDIGEGGRSLIKLDREYCCIDRAYDYICDLQTIDEIDPETRSADELKRACDAFGGELLEGYYFNHCEDLNELILSQRIYYEKRKNRLLMKAAELYEQRDMLPEAVGILERVMEYEPYNEQLALRLMTLYERGGDRSRAIRFFNEFRNRLASNLEIYPGSAITQRRRSLRRRGPMRRACMCRPTACGRCPASGWRTRWGSCWTPSGTTCGRTTGRCCGCWGLYSPLRRCVPARRVRSRPHRRQWPRRLSGGSPVWRRGSRWRCISAAPGRWMTSAAVCWSICCRSALPG